VKTLIFILTLLCWPPAGPPAEAGIAAPAAESLFEAPSRHFGLSKSLVMAIAQVESGFHPWALNIEGKPYLFDSKEEVLRKAEEAQAAGRSFDVGLMQVNNWWLNRYGVSLEAALDPLANTFFGGWILYQELTRHRTVREAVGAYHSPDQDRASRYADQVLSALARGPLPTKTAVPGQAREKRAASQDQPSQEHREETAPGPMTVVSDKAGMANPNSLKVAGTAPQNSMKIKVKK
jgi:soluble lytic murein transglycosylase-like protein